MPKCKICLEDKKLYFDTSNMRICKNCIDFLNNHKKPVENSYIGIGEMHRRGMEKKIHNALNNKGVSEWGVQEAKRILENFEKEYEESLPKRINELLSDNSIPATNDIKKIIRAVRRRILYRNPPINIGRPSNWETIAKGVRKNDHLSCQKCREKGDTLDVHHIIYVQNLGTHSQNNLVTLCRACHEKEHGRSFRKDMEYSQKVEILPVNQLQESAQSIYGSEQEVKPKEDDTLAPITTPNKKNTYNIVGTTIHIKKLIILLNHKEIDFSLVEEKLNSLNRKGYTDKEITDIVADDESTLDIASLSLIMKQRQEIHSSKEYINKNDDKSLWDDYWHLLVILLIVFFIIWKYA